MKKFKIRSRQQNSKRVVIQITSECHAELLKLKKEHKITIDAVVEQMIEHCLTELKND